MTMTVAHLVHDVWHIAVIGLGLLLSVFATGHVVLYKRDSRSAHRVGGFRLDCAPIGAVMYFFFGVNRIRRKETFLLRRDLERYRAEATQPGMYAEELQRHPPHHRGYLETPAGSLERRGGVALTAWE